MIKKYKKLIDSMNNKKNNITEILEDFRNKIYDVQKLVACFNYASSNTYRNLKEENLNNPSEQEAKVEDIGIIPGEEHPFVMLSTTKKELEELIKPSYGWCFSEISKYCLVMIVEYWNLDIRKKLDSVLGIKNFESDIMGDLNLIRNDIVHHKAKVSKKNTKRCKKIKFFTDKEFIEINLEKILAIIIIILDEINDISQKYTEEKLIKNLTLTDTSIRLTWNEEKKNELLGISQAEKGRILIVRAMLFKEKGFDNVKAKLYQDNTMEEKNLNNIKGRGSIRKSV